MMLAFLLYAITSPLIKWMNMAERRNFKNVCGKIENNEVNHLNVHLIESFIRSFLFSFYTLVQFIRRNFLHLIYSLINVCVYIFHAHNIIFWAWCSLQFIRESKYKRESATTTTSTIQKLWLGIKLRYFSNM